MKFLDHTERKDNEKAAERFRDLLQEWECRPNPFLILDEVLLGYASNTSGKDGIPESHIEETLLFVKYLRDIFIDSEL